MVRYDRGNCQDGKRPTVGRLVRARLVGTLLTAGVAALGVVTPAWAAPNSSAAPESDAVAQPSAPIGNRLEGLFGTREFRSGNPAVVPQWEDAARRLARDAPAIAACDADPDACRSPRVRRWRAQVRDLQGADPLAQLDAINRFANDIVPYRDDRRVYRREDHWAAPLQMLRQAGDCEDYALLKFASLLDLGFRNDQMRIAVVHDLVRDLAHAVLVVEWEGGAYVLDNQFDDILPLAGVGRYRPYYSLNLTHHWAHITLVADAGSAAASGGIGGTGTDEPVWKSAKASRMGVSGR